MKVLVTGATGFTGSYTIPLLLKRGYRVRCFVRPTSDINGLLKENIELCKGDLNENRDLERCLDNVDAFINIASLGFGHGQLIVNALQEKGIKRAIFVSTTAIFTNLNSASKTTRLAAEKNIEDSGLEYTIIRPTMIYGDGNDRNMCRLVKYIKKMPAIPIFGSGEYLQQPVFVGDVASVLCDVLDNKKTYSKSYNIGGAKALTYNEVIDTVATLLRKKIRKIHMPAEPVVNILQIFEKMTIPLPLKAEQIQRLNEHKAFDITDAAHDFGYKPLTFREGMERELRVMGIL